jgi:hypothetical protein
MFTYKYTRRRDVSKERRAGRDLSKALHVVRRDSAARRVQAVREPQDFTAVARANVAPTLRFGPMLDGTTWSISFSVLSDPFVPRVDWPLEHRRICRPLLEADDPPDEALRPLTKRENRVLAALRTAGAPVRTAALCERLELEPEAARRALHRLVDHCLARRFDFMAWEAVL